MKRVLIVLVIVTIFLCGCVKTETEETEETQQRFVIEYKQRLDLSSVLNIIRDTETGKAYLFVKSGYGGGLTILEDGEQ